MLPSIPDAAVPVPTIDWTIEDPLAEIPIEERSAEEVRVVRGVDAAGKAASVRIAPEQTVVANPAFDVTPAALVTGIITDRGIVRANESEILRLFPRRQRSHAFVT